MPPLLIIVFPSCRSTREETRPTLQLTQASSFLTRATFHSIHQEKIWSNLSLTNSRSTIVQLCLKAIWLPLLSTNQIKLCSICPVYHRGRSTIPLQNRICSSTAV